ncbi:Fuca, partial [Trypoxylus dichotomus]
YVVLTSKHHEGYTLWPSTYSYSWNSVDVGSHRDLLDELTKAVRAAGLRMGYYYSLLEWYNPLYIRDKAANFETTFYSDNKAQPELRELVEKYKPDIVWSDGEWEANDTYWKSREFLTWLYNVSPVRDEVVANDRWGSKLLCKHGDFYTCVDRYNPGVLQPHKWENAMTIDKRTWGYRGNAKLEEYMSSYELIVTLVQTISCGGNILINVGPTKEGTIIPIYQERLLDLGKWLNINGEAIYSSSPWEVQNDTLNETWYTAKGKAVYAICLNWPRNRTYDLGSAAKLFASKSTTVELLGYGSVE